MQDEYVRIILPIDNNFAKLKRTLDSIKRQSYSLENIIVIATIFNKIDEELYLWLLNYPLPHLAVYKRGGNWSVSYKHTKLPKELPIAAADCV